MDLKLVTFCGICIATFLLPFISGQTLAGETLIPKSFCDLNNITLSCNTESIIALKDVQLGFNNTRCSQECCSFSIDDCIVNLADIQTVKRECSGQSTCSPHISSDVEFCNFGRVQASYLYFEYVCIPKSRVTSVCSNSTVDSPTGKPLYLTNRGFPGVTTAVGSCSCSFEAESCSSDTTSFLIDVDLYLDTSYCLQEITFTDSNNSSLGNVGCESYYDDYIIQKHFKTNYARINFINNSTERREGIFIIGLQATEPNVTLRISCPTAQPTWCIDCGSPDQPTNGKVILDNPSDTGYSATASVTCKPGFNANATTITCQGRGVWEAQICTALECGSVAKIQYGRILLEDCNNSSYGSSGVVVCDTGYTANTSKVFCLKTGLWEVASCYVYLQEKNTQIVAGVIGGVIGIAATIAVLAIVFLIRNHSTERKENATARAVASPEEMSTVQTYQQLEPVSRIEDVDHYRMVTTDTELDRSTGYANTGQLQNA